MITVNGHVLTPTLFPDGTSQVWDAPEGNLPDELLSNKVLKIDWRFESERELFDLFSLRRLLRSDACIHLHVPYLPYARQDKPVHFRSSFNLAVFADLINSLNLTEVTAVDVHNPARTIELIHNFRNIEVTQIHKKLIGQLKPDYVVLPDDGARIRYARPLYPQKILVLEKVREQATGRITSHKVTDPSFELQPHTKFLIIDDLCDGGATFLSIAKMFNQRYECSHTISLFVTHGLFTKGRKTLEDAGIQLFTTNSLPRNVMDDMGQFEV